MSQNNLRKSNENGLLSKMALSSWKNGILVDKNNKSRNLAVLVLASELIMALIGTLFFSQIFVSFPFQMKKVYLIYFI